MTKYVSVVDLDVTQKYFDLLAIAIIETEKEGDFTYTYDSPEEFSRIVYFQAYDDTWESVDQINVTREGSSDSLPVAEKMLLILVFKVTS